MVIYGSGKDRRLHGILASHFSDKSKIGEEI